METMDTWREAKLLICPVLRRHGGTRYDVPQTVHCVLLAVLPKFSHTVIDGMMNSRMQSQIRYLVFLVAISASFAVGIRTANADSISEWERFLDVYGGYSVTADDTVDARRITTNFIIVTDESASRSVSYDPTFTVGARFGAYYDIIGLALDMSYFEANDKNLQNSIFSISALLMARAQFLETDDMPQGRLQPYLAVGPGFFFVSHDVDFRPDISSRFDFTDGHVGLDARAGLRWLFSKNMGLYTEYRLTHFSSNSVSDTVKINGQPTERVNATMTTHHVLGGLTFSF
jgi:opacity protein-like surface antigen